MQEAVLSMRESTWPGTNNPRFSWLEWLTADQFKYLFSKYSKMLKNGTPLKYDIADPELDQESLYDGEQDQLALTNAEIRANTATAILNLVNRSLSRAADPPVMEPHPIFVSNYGFILVFRPVIATDFSL